MVTAFAILAMFLTEGGQKELNWIKLGGSSTNSFLFFKVKPGQVESNLP